MLISVFMSLVRCRAAAQASRKNRTEDDGRREKHLGEPTGQRIGAFDVPVRHGEHKQWQCEHGRLDQISSKLASLVRALALVRILRASGLGVGCKTVRAHRLIARPLHGSHENLGRYSRRTRFDGCALRYQVDGRRHNAADILERFLNSSHTCGACHADDGKVDSVCLTGLGTVS